jgi:NAD(P)-dependent dehydrogenase (short-subunit alcohol dehydrogenase family)
MSSWTAADIPSQAGRTAIVTGANSGIGLEAARELARAGAHVILAVRDEAKGEAARAQLPGSTEVRRLDLASLASVRAFADGVDRPVDLLVNNAGIMAVPEGRTADGFELHLGTNHLGHFALTGLLLDRVRDRVVTVASLYHRIGIIRLDDLQFDRGYRRWAAYAQSKLANLLFTFELQRRLTAAGSPVIATAAHPGYSATHLQSHSESFRDGLMQIANRVFAQSAAMGALPTLYAATADVPPGSYAGPSRRFESQGPPRLVRTAAEARDEAVAARLWTRSEELTGVSFGLPAPASA